MDKILNCRLALFMLVGALGFSSCKVYKQSILFSTDQEQNTKQLQQEVDAAQRNYTVKPYDYITFSVYTNKGERIIDPDFELSKESSIALQNQQAPKQYIVRPDGSLDLPMIGNVKVDGLKINQLDSTLQVLYNNFYSNSYVVSRIANKRVVVIGATGGYIIPFQNENMSLIEALAIAMPANQGVTRFNAQNIRLIRGNLTNPEVYIIDLSTIEGMKKSQTQLQPDDIIYIEPVVRVFNESVRDAAPIIGLVTNIITLLLIIQSTQNN